MRGAIGYIIHSLHIKIYLRDQRMANDKDRGQYFLLNLLVKTVAQSRWVE